MTTATLATTSTTPNYTAIKTKQNATWGSGELETTLYCIQFDRIERLEQNERYL